jgi:putative MFS transporter
MATAESIATYAGAEILARMERLPISWWHVKARIVVGIGTFFDAVDLLAIAYVLPVLVGLWHMNPAQIALVLSAAFWGQLIGALTAGWAAEKWGRLRVTTIAIGLYSITSLACAFAWSPMSLVVLRFIQGIGLGAEVPIANTYVNEIARAEVRGRFYLLFQMVFGIGIVTASVLGYFLVPTIGWQSMFYIGALPALLAFVMRFMLPESPRWLVQKGRYAEADRIITGIEESITRSGKTLPPPNPAAVPIATAQRTRWFEMFQGIYLKRTLSDWAFWFCCFSTSYGLSTWLPTLYRTVFHLSVVDSLKYGMITSSGGIVAALCCAFFIDYVGRRAWFTGAFILGGITLLLLWPVGTDTAEKVLIFVTIGNFFISSLALAINLYTSEIYPTRIRAFAGAVGGAWQRVAAILGTNVVAWLLPFGTGSLFLYFGGLAVLGGVLAFCFAIETKGKTLEELSP